MWLNEFGFKILKVIKLPIRKAAYFLGLRKYETTESYKTIIPAEVTEGHFYELIKNIASREDVTTILEIGSSSGEGSTKALVEAANLFPSSPKQIHCLEISMERFGKLRNYLRNDKRFYAHRISSVMTSEFPTFGEINNFHKKRKTNLNKIHINTIAAWYNKDIQFITDNPELNPISKSGHKISGIDWIKEKYHLSTFDFVIIDGSEFTGMAEYLKIRGSRFIALDDVMSFKCLNAYEALSADDNYELISENLIERNGWAVFGMKTTHTPAVIEKL